MRHRSKQKIVYISVQQTQSYLPRNVSDILVTYRRPSRPDWGIEGALVELVAPFLSTIISVPEGRPGSAENHIALLSALILIHVCRFSKQIPLMK